MQSENKNIQFSFMWMLIVALLISSMSCQNDKTKMAKEDHSPVAQFSPVTAKYNLNEPDEVWSLSARLKEISGLSYDSTSNELLAVNDEMGVYYRLDISNGEISNKQSFAKKGDYEGIEIVYDKIYIVESNGKIHYIDNDDKTDKMNTSLSGANDIEGLGYDPTNSMLLLACKGKPSISDGQHLKKTKVVYGFNLKTSKFNEEPFLVVADSSLIQFCEQELLSSEADQNKVKQYRKRLKSFSPSAIAYNLQEDAFYLLSSVGKLLVVIDRQSKIKSLDFLDEGIHRQPEGITFDNDYNLYVSNEGKFGVARIFKYNY